MIFKQIEGTNYEVSMCGKVRNMVTQKFITPRPGGTSDYLIATCKVDGKAKNYLLHRLIAKAFIPNPENKAEVNHKDCNKLNNSIENLEWVTRSENQKHSWDSGLRTYRPLHYKGKFGKDHNRSKRVRCIEKDLVFGSMSEAGRILNIHFSSVSWSIKTGKPIYGMHFELNH